MKIVLSDREKFACNLRRIIVNTNEKDDLHEKDIHA
jgi:hypothetical protein